MLKPDRANKEFSLQWEYWPFEVFYFPVFLYYAWLSIKAKTPFFFVATNPGIEFGGMMGEEKYPIYQSLPQSMIPKTLLVKSGSSFEELIERIYQSGIAFPMIAKPNVGERGTKVRVIENEQECKRYALETEVDFLVQEFIDLNVEAGIFYYRMPHDLQGKISSLVLKEWMTIIGDGAHTIAQLMERTDRYKRQIDRMKTENENLLNRIPKIDEVIRIEPIGNHCRGTKFLDGNHLITSELKNKIDEIAKSYSGFYYGRFDVKAKSLTHLSQGEFTIIELNGAGAEPAHIYDPSFSLFNAYSVILHHFKVMYQISQENIKLGYPIPRWNENFKTYKKALKYRKLLQQ